MIQTEDHTENTEITEAAPRKRVMSKKRLLEMAIRAFEGYQDPYYQGFAAQVAFYMLLSLVPTIVLISQLLGVFSLSLEALSGWLTQYVSEDMAAALERLLAFTPSVKFSVFMVVIALWAASRAQFCLMRITNYTVTGGRTTGAYWSERFRSLQTMIFTLFTYTFAIGVFVYGDVVAQVMVSAISGNFGFDHEISAYWGHLRWPAALGLYFLMVLYNYYVLPIEKMTFKQVLPGSVFASVAMLFITIVYAIWVGFIARYDLVYGSLASIAAIMFYLYFIAWALGIGSMVNRVWMETADI